jgi:hypothetical protein
MSTFAHFKRFHFRCATKRFFHNADLGFHVLRVVEVLPRATTTTARNMWARWLHSVRRCFNNVGYRPASKILLALRDLHIDQFACKRTWHKHHTAIGQAAQRISTGDKPFYTYLFAIHSY